MTVQLETMAEMFLASRREYPHNGRRPTVAVFSDISGGDLVVPEIAWLGQRSPEVTHAGNSLQSHIKGVVVLAETTSWAGAARMRAAIPFTLPKVQGVTREHLSLVLCRVFEKDLDVLGGKLVVKAAPPRPEDRPDHFDRKVELAEGEEFTFRYSKKAHIKPRLAPGEMARFIVFVGDVNFDDAYNEGQRLYRLSGRISNPSVWKDQVKRLRRRLSQPVN